MHRIRRLILNCFVVILAMFVSFGAGAASLDIVTTTTVFADLIKQVGGDRVNVVSIVPAGADPHTFEPTPREARHIATADVLFVNGLGFEAWVEKLLVNAGSPNLQVVTLSQGLEPIEGVSFTVHQGHDDHDHAHDGDPHFWLDVTHAMHYVRTIESVLIAADPAGAEGYRSRAAAYLAELDELDQWIAERIATIPAKNRVLLTYHDAFAYLAQRYGLDLQGVVVRNPDREPSSRELASLIREVRALGTKAIFAEPQINPRFAQSLAAEAGIKVAYLYSDALTAQVPTYVDMMRYNANSLVEALR